MGAVYGRESAGRGEYDESRLNGEYRLMSDVAVFGGVQCMYQPLSFCNARIIHHSVSPCSAGSRVQHPGFQIQIDGKVYKGVSECMYMQE